MRRSSSSPQGCRQRTAPVARFIATERAANDLDLEGVTEADAVDTHRRTGEVIPVVFEDAVRDRGDASLDGHGTRVRVVVVADRHAVEFARRERWEIRQCVGHGTRTINDRLARPLRRSDHDVVLLEHETVGIRACRKDDFVARSRGIDGLLDGGILARNMEC